MARPDVQVNVRLPADLLETLKAAAIAAERSLTAEITSRLEASFPKTLQRLKLDQLLNTIYVTQALEYRLGLELEQQRPGTTKHDKILDELRDVKAELGRLFTERNSMIDRMKNADEPS